MSLIPPELFFIVLVILTLYASHSLQSSEEQNLADAQASAAEGGSWNIKSCMGTGSGLLSMTSIRRVMLERAQVFNNSTD